MAKHDQWCLCSKCVDRWARQQQKKRDRQNSRNRGGMHVGRPHTSRNDPRIHVTSTLRDSNGKKLRNNQHHSSLGSIAHGWAAFEESQENKS